MTTSRIVRRVTVTAVVAGAAAFAAAPAFAKPGPIDYGSLQNRPGSTKAQIEHAEAGTVSNTGGLAPFVRARVERMQRATADREPVQPARQDPADPSSFPVTSFALIGGGLVAAGAAAGVTAYRFRHHGAGATDGHVGTAAA